MSKQTSDWNAWYNVQPGSPNSLHVSGKIDVGNESDGAVLVFDSHEKPIPPNLVLNIAESTIFVPREPGDHIVSLKYDELAEVGTYGAIKILLDGEIVKEIPAEEIQIIH